MRSLVHFYIPSFCAAIEQLRKPELAGRPVIVTNRSGGTEFVVSASTEAKAEGVREGMTARHAGRYCPNGMFIPADWGAYKDVSDQVLEILSGYSPLLEPHWLDRAYMDLTGCPRETFNVQRFHAYGGIPSEGGTTFNVQGDRANGRVGAPGVRENDVRPEPKSAMSECIRGVPHPPFIGIGTPLHAGLASPQAVIAQIQHIIKERTGLTVSAGIAQNKLLAHAAASACRAGECMTIEPGTEREFLAPLMVSHLPGVGPKIEKRLMALGVMTIGELAAIPCPMLARQFGAVGTKLHRLANGIDFSQVKALYPPETIIAEHTFDSISDAPSEPEAALEYLGRMSSRVSAKLSKQNRKAGTVSLRLEFDDRNVCIRSYVPKTPISSMHEVYFAVKRILRQEMYGAPIVSIRLTLSDLRVVEGFQLNFLEDTERKQKLQQLFAQIHTRFGERALVYGATLVA